MGCALRQMQVQFLFDCSFGHGSRGGMLGSESESVHESEMECK